MEECLVEDQRTPGKRRTDTGAACKKDERRSELCKPVGERKNEPRKEVAQETG